MRPRWNRDEDRDHADPHSVHPYRMSRLMKELPVSHCAPIRNGMLHAGMDLIRRRRSFRLISTTIGLATFVVPAGCTDTKTIEPSRIAGPRLAMHSITHQDSVQLGYFQPKPKPSSPIGGITNP